MERTAKEITEEYSKQAAQYGHLILQAKMNQKELLKLEETVFALNEEMGALLKKPPQETL